MTRYVIIAHLDANRLRRVHAGDQSCDFDAQPITPFELELKKGDQMFTRCTHSNEGDTPIVYGESSDTEMCILVMYYAPIGMPGVCIKS